MAEKSRILVIGGTGYIGKFIVEASAKAGHPTFALIRESTASSKRNLIDKFQNLGVNFLNVCCIFEICSDLSLILLNLEDYAETLVCFGLVFGFRAICMIMEVW